MKLPRLTKKMVSLSVAGSLSLSLLSAASGAAAEAQPQETVSATDIKGHWAEKDIARWIADGLITGYGDGSFQPNKAVTRAEFIALVNRAFGYAEAGSSTFTDLPSSAWSYPDVQKAVKAGYITGFADGSVHPNAPITRQEIAVIVERLLGLKPSEQDAGSFKDAASIPSWSKGAVGAAKANGIMNGYEDNAFRPTNNATRAEAVVILSHALQAKAAPETFAEAGVYGPESGMQTISGDVVISAPGVTLRNTVIEGNLTFAAGIGEGDAVLDHVTVKGTTLVQGGGAHSLHFEDSVLLTIVVDKSAGTVRIVAEGSTTVASVEMQTGATLEESELTGEGFTDVKLSALLPQGTLITLVGSFDDVDVSSVKVKVAIPSGSVQQITVGEEAEGNGFDLGASARAVNLVLYAAADFVGGGTIESVRTMSQAARDASTFQTHPWRMQDGGGSVYYPAPSSGLTQQQIDRQAADRVSALIAALPAAADLTLAANEAGVGAANDAFAALSTAQQALVSAENQAKLTGAAARIAELKADKAAADAVIALVAALPATDSLALTDEAAVTAASDAFAALTAVRQALVPAETQAKLAGTVARIAALQADKAAADAVAALIEALPAAGGLTLADETAVNAAGDAYAALTADQQAFVAEENRAKLTESAARIAELKADKAAADAVSALIAGLPATASLTLADAGGVGTANDAFAALSAARKALVMPADQAKLADAVARIAELSADKAAADAVTARIAALPATGSLALGDEADVAAANDAFAALTGVQQALVSAADQTKLADAVARIAVLKADRAAADAVIALIEALPATGSLTLADAGGVAAANDPFAALTGDQQALVSAANQTKLADAVARIAVLKADKAAADAVSALIAGLPATASLTLDDADGVTAANDAFAGLTSDQQDLVPQANQTKLADAVAQIAKLQADKAAADAVISQIAALPATASLTLDDADGVAAANDAFAGLTSAQQDLVPQASQTKLTGAVARIAELKADKAAADAVTAQIADLPAIGSLALGDETDVTAANDAFVALTAVRQALVPAETQTKLADAVARIAVLKADRAAADAVIALIEALPSTGSLTLASEAAVNGANQAFTALTSDQQALVSLNDKDQLTDAVGRIAEMKADKAAADLVAAQIAALPATASLTLANEAAVNAAHDAYANLTPAQQAYIGASDLAALNAAVAKISDLKADQAAANAVIDQIAALPAAGNLTLADEAAVTAARAAYDGLSAARQALVTNLNVLVQAETRMYQLNHPYLTSLPVTNLDFATIAATQAMGVSSAVPGSTDYTGDNSIDFTIEFTYANVPRTVHVLLNWNIAPNGFTPGQIVGGVVDSYIQQFCLDNGIDLMQRPIMSFGTDNTFMISASVTGAQGSFKVGGRDAARFFGAQTIFSGMDTNTSKNRVFTVSDGTRTASIALTRTYATMDSLVTALNSQLRSANVAAVAAKADGTHFTIAPSVTGGSITIGGADKDQFFSDFQLN